MQYLTLISAGVFYPLLFQKNQGNHGINEGRRGNITDSPISLCSVKTSMFQGKVFLLSENTDEVFTSFTKKKKGELPEYSLLQKYVDPFSQRFVIFFPPKFSNIV